MPRSPPLAPSALVLCATLVVGACRPAEPPPALELPARPAAARTWTELAPSLRSLGLEGREARLLEEVRRGNVPPWLRRLRRVEMSASTEGTEHRIEFWVTPDYLALGSDTDYVLTPLSPGTAQRIADLVGGSLPTPRMVDAVWRAAETRLAPQRLRPDHEMRSVGYFERHNDLIAGQRLRRGLDPGAFVAGHKKDVVLSTELDRITGKVAIYGWHRLAGRPIQSLSTVLGDDVVDFSHGIRIVHREIRIDGVSWDLVDALRDPEVAPLLSADGVIHEPRYPTTGGADE